MVSATVEQALSSEQNLTSENSQCQVGATGFHGGLAIVLDKWCLIGTRAEDGHGLTRPNGHDWHNRLT